MIGWQQGQGVVSHFTFDPQDEKMDEWVLMGLAPIINASGNRKADPAEMCILFSDSRHLTR